jgi:hypothetical protein
VYNPDRIMLANLRALFGVVVDIVLLRRGPEHLPASPVLLAIVIGFYAVASIIVGKLVGPASGSAHLLPLLAFEIIATLLWYRVALQLAGKRERFVQAMTAMFAINLILLPLIIPLAAPLVAQMQAQQDPSTLLKLIAFALLAWWIAANGNVIKSTFEWPWFAAILMLLAQKFSLSIAAELMFGGAAPPA